MMDKGRMDERDNPKALLNPGTVPLPVHNFIDTQVDTDSEDNLPSTIDLDALKGSGLQETSFESMSCWRGGTPRAKPRLTAFYDAMDVSTPGSGMSSFVTAIGSVSDDSKVIDTSSESIESSEMSGSSSPSDSSSSSSSDSSCSDSDSTDSGDKIKRGKKESTPLKRSPRKIEQSNLKPKPKYAHSNNNSSTSSRNKNHRKKSFFNTVNYEPGSLKLRLSVFDPSSSKNVVENTTQAPVISPQKSSLGNKWKTARLSNGEIPPAPAPIPKVNGTYQPTPTVSPKVNVKTTPTLPAKVSTQSTPPISLAKLPVGQRRVTRQSNSHKADGTKVSSVSKTPLPVKVDSLQKNGLVVKSSPTTVRKSRKVESKSLPFSFNNNNNIVPVGQTSQLTDSVTMTRVSAPITSTILTGPVSKPPTPSRLCQKKGKQEQLTNPVLYLSKKSRDLSIVPITTTTKVLSKGTKKSDFGFSQAVLSELCYSVKNKLIIDKGLISSSSKSKKGNTSSPTRKIEPFTFKLVKFKNFTPPFPMSPHARNNHIWHETSPSKSSVQRGVSSGSPTKRKRASMLPKCRSTSSLDGNLENATDLQKLPLKKRHGHGNLHYDGPVDDDGSQDENPYSFGSTTPLHSCLLPQKSSLGIKLSPMKSYPQFSDFRGEEDVKPGTDVKIEVKQTSDESTDCQPQPQQPQRGRPRKKEESVLSPTQPTTTTTGGRKKRRANRTGFPTVKRKKKKLSSSPATAPASVASSAETESKSGIISSSGTDEDAAAMDIDDDEQNEQPSTSTKVEDSFTSSLTERVKIRRRNSIDSITKEERLLIASGELEVPGVIPSFMDVVNPPLVLPQKLNYLKAGLLSKHYKRTEEPIPIDENLSLTQLLALHGGKMSKDELFPTPADTGFKWGIAPSLSGNYQLPYDIYCLGVIRTMNCYEEWARKEEDMRAEERLRKKSESRKLAHAESVVAKKRKIPMPEVTPDSWHFKKLKSNIYFGYNKPPVSAENDQLCECKDGEFKCASDDCLNRVVFTECPQNCGENCMNRRIQKHDWAPQLKRFLTEGKGYGVNSLVAIKKGDFILEYVGEVVPAAEFRRRMLEVYQHDIHHYCLQLDSNRVIDGHRSGDEGRFVNHSCEPNCEMQKWSVNGLFRMALFALRDIPAEEELSYDYNFSLYNETEGQPCKCESENCRGVIGGKSKSNAKDVNRRKNTGSHKGPHGDGDSLLRKHLDPNAKMRVLSKKEVKFVQTGNVFLVKNYEKIRLSRYRATDDDTERVCERVEKVMTGWISRCRIGSSKYKPLILTGEEPKVTRLARMAQIFFDLYRHITSAKDTSGRSICDLFMEYPGKRSCPIFHSTIQKSKLFGFSSIEKRIIRGEYKSLAVLEEDIRIVLSTFAQAYEAERPEAKGLVDRIKKIYKEAKNKAVQALDPFIVTQTSSSSSPIRGGTPSGSPTKNALPPFIESELSHLKDQVRCICGTFYEEGMMVQCEKCLVWQHCDCMKMPYGSLPSNSKSDKGKMRRGGSGRKQSKKEVPPVVTENREVKDNQKVKLDSGEMIDITEELPLLEVAEDISEMETQAIEVEEPNMKIKIKDEGENEDEKAEPPYYCELCEPREVDLEVPMGGGNDTPNQTFYLTLRREDGLILRKNDTVYVLRDWPEDQRTLSDGTPRPRNTYLNAGPLIKEECDIFRIANLWKDEHGNRMAMGYNYLRPHETHHEPNRRFYPNEILKAPIHEIIGIELIHGRCWVLDTATYCKGRPIGCDEQHLYICDLRVNKAATSFDKIGKRSQTICIKPFAFKHFVTKIRINRNIHPHGPPSPDFKLRPTSVQITTEKKKSQNSESKYKSMAGLGRHNQQQKLGRENLHKCLIDIASKIENYEVDAINLSHLFEKSRKSKNYKSSR